MVLPYSLFIHLGEERRTWAVSCHPIAYLFMMQALLALSMEVSQVLFDLVTL
jgi:hypothetical protein